MIKSIGGSLESSGATLLVTATGQLYLSVPSAAAATACAGLVTSSAANMSVNVDKFASSNFSTQNRGTNNIRVLQKTKIKGYEVSVDLEKGGSGLNNIHAEVDGKKYYLDDETEVFLDKDGNRLPNKLRGNSEISKAVDKANKLISQGW